MKIIDIFSGNEQIYNLFCTSIDLPGSPVNFMGCELAPGEASEAHNHFENELFVFTKGYGEVSQDGKTIAVKAGDAVQFDRFENHIILNTSTTEPLFFHSLYWASSENSQKDEAKHLAQPMLVFSTPPTPNGDLHLGHLSGPYLAADILTRTMRAQGVPVRHVTGRDDNQTYVLTCGLREGRSPEKTATFYDEMLRNTWDLWGIERDGYINPTETPRYDEFVRHGISLLRKQGLIVAKTEMAAFDVDGTYLHEAYISGGCPHCGESSDGNACEACGRPNDCVDLIDARSRLTDEPIQTAPVERLFFRLSAFSAELAQYVKSSNMPAHVAALSLDMISDGLPDICISHPGPWGLSYAEANFEDHRIYVWFEMAFGYLWGAAASPEASVEDIMQAAAEVYNGQTQVAHCYGFDNAYYHTLLFPAVHIALGLTPADTHIVNELLDLDGQKFSTSRRHLIWGRDFVQALPLDYARFALMLNRPETTRENFAIKSTVDTLEDLFSQRTNRWLDRFTTNMAARLHVLPEPGAWLADQRSFYDWLIGQMALLKSAQSLVTFSPRRTALVIRDLIVECERFSVGQQYLFRNPQPGTGNYARTALALDALALSLLADACKAIMPEFSVALSNMLGQSMPVNGEFLTGGQDINAKSRPYLQAMSSTIADDVMPAQSAFAQSSQ